MGKFWENIGKIASLGVIVVLLHFGTTLLNETESLGSIASFVGAGLVFVAITLAVLFFMDWRRREGYEHLVKQQEGVIKSLGDHVHQAAKTYSAIQKQTRSALDSGSTQRSIFADKKEEYKIDEKNNTQDD